MAGLQNGSFTHIVVGAGSAGCVVAARIAEKDHYNVLLVEAGQDCSEAGILPAISNARKVPMRGQTDNYDPEIDWDVSVDMPNSAPMRVPQAKVVGGGSSINGGTALRNTTADAREWVSLGNTEWSFDQLFSVYESMEQDRVRQLDGYHPIERCQPEETGTIQNAFVQAAIMSGLKYVLDQNEVDAEGVSPSPVCRRGDQRVSSANSFVDPIRGKANFTLLCRNTVDRVIMDNKKAVGIRLANGKDIYASHEIILCAGPIFSPAILQRSGIGPASILSKLGIPQVLELPVGLNLSDHPCIPIVSRPRPGSYDKNDYSLQYNARWSSCFSRAIDLQLVCFSYLYSDHPDRGSARQQRSLSGQVSGHVAGVGCNINKPTSRGSVAIASQNVNDQPKVAPMYLDTLHDRTVARELVRKGYQVVMAMQSAIEKPIGLNDDIVNSDALLDNYIQSQVTSTFHFCGTCRMANRDKEGVVDQCGRVYGVESLRVADSSVIPTIPAANTMWTTMMFAERIGTSIRDGKDLGRARPIKLS